MIDEIGGTPRTWPFYNGPFSPGEMLKAHVFEDNGVRSKALYEIWEPRFLADLKDITRHKVTMNGSAAILRYAVHGNFDDIRNCFQSFYYGHLARDWYKFQWVAEEDSLCLGYGTIIFILTSRRGADGSEIPDPQYVKKPVTEIKRRNWFQRLFNIQVYQ